MNEGDSTKLEFAVHKSIRYHGKRRAFFDGLHNAAMVTVAMGGSAAFAALLTEGTASIGVNLPLYVSGIIAAVSAFDLVLGFPTRARVHDSLYRRYCDLAAEIASAQNPDEITKTRWGERRLLIEKDEPTPVDALNVICHNQEAEARGYTIDDGVLVRIRWWQVLFSQFLTLPPNSFPPRTPAK